MADVILSDGRELAIDLSKITISEYRAMHKENQDVDVMDECIGKTVGLSKQEIQALPFSDYPAVAKAFWDKIKGLLDPNSASESTKES